VNADQRSGREIRLLVLVIGVAVAVLLVLARFRFPAVDLSANPQTPGPLERLAARATFDDLASTLADVTTRVTPAFIVVAVEKIPEKPERKGGPPPPAAASGPRWVPALRVRPEFLLVYVPTGTHVVAVEGLSASPQVAVSDPIRELALIPIPRAVSPTADFAGAVSDFSGFTFVAAVEGAVGGPAVRPVFVPRADALFESRWSTTLLLVGGEPELHPGAFVFTLDGRLIGLAVREEAGVAIVPAAALDRVITELANRAGGGQR